MSYDAALAVRDEVNELCKRNPNIVMVGIENIGGRFGVLVGAMQPSDVDLPKELDNVPIRVVYQSMPSTEEYRITE